TDNPFAQFFANIAGPWSDWLFMIGLLGIGIALLTGAGLKIAAWSGTALLLFMYLAQFPLYEERATNPITDSHWVEALALIVVAATYAGDTWGIGKWWGRHVGNGILR
ncbi:MAG TPA: DoxX family protein, partial [Intrasporangium sp.]|nr:DoxX family protein [Intrasporangium sp.]